MKEYKSYVSDLLTLTASETASTEVKIYKDFYCSKIKLKISNVNPEHVLLEIEKYLPILNYKMLLNEEETNTYNYILSVPKKFPAQNLILNITNRHSTDTTTAQIFLYGYEETKRELDLSIFDQAKVKTVIDDLQIIAGSINTSLTHMFNDDILIENITKYFVSGDEKNILFNIRNETRNYNLFDSPVNLAFVNSFVHDKYDLYTPVIFKRKDVVRFYIQNIHTTNPQRFSLALHGRELRKDGNK
jgi:hypothetical protein